MKQKATPTGEAALEADALAKLKKENEQIKQLNINLANALRSVRNQLAKLSGALTSALGE